MAIFITGLICLIIILVNYTDISAALFMLIICGYILGFGGIGYLFYKRNK